jgi:ribose-phosphate pyrophosphokinase
MVFAGRSHPQLAGDIAGKLGLELGEITLKTFANGETYVRYEESIRGADLFLVQTGCEPVDRNLMELLIMIQAAKLASAKRITAVIPWYPYSRQDKKSAPREPITGKLVADFLRTAGVDRVLTMDLHAGQVQGFFDIPVDHMTALPLFAQHFRDQGLSGEGVVSVAPDAGRAKMGVKFAQMVEGDFAIMHKTRPAHDVAAISEVTGDVRGKRCLVGDDVIMTGGTIISGARALKEAGATEVHVFATHAIFAKGALDRFAEAEEVDRLIVTDTVPIDPRDRAAIEKLTVLPISGLLAETIWNVFSDESVSAIFAGENQLF